MFRVLLVLVCLFVCSLAQAQYEGQVVIMYDGPSIGAPSYTGGCSGGSGGYTQYRQVYTGPSYSGSCSGGSVQMYSQPVRYYQQPVYRQQYYQPYYGGYGGGVSFSGGWGAYGGGRMVCGPNGCSYQ